MLAATFYRKIKGHAPYGWQVRFASNQHVLRTYQEIAHHAAVFIMTSLPSCDVTRILKAIDEGDPNAAKDLLPLVYDELRKLAAARIAQEAAGQTLQATALVHEAWLRLAGSERQQFSGRAHFFGAAAEAMRRILIDKAREKNSQKRGADPRREELHESRIELRAPVGRSPGNPRCSRCAGRRRPNGRRGR